ncbi:pentapeptide repeat-containing protein [Pandoraea pneumonica]|uniref:pentapeptide repeat-containing protein n=1 Tax=Pandoraea pneumonica TaxID=2508299 RepID=UPI003CEE78D0
MVLLTTAPNRAPSVPTGTALSYHELEQLSAAPPEALRWLILRAGADERRVLGQQVAWLMHVLAHDTEASDQPFNSRGSAELPGGCLSQGALPLDEAALTTAWRLRFAHLVPDGNVSRVLRALIQWCEGSPDVTATTKLAQWHWLPAAEVSGFDTSSCEGTPVREWPPAVLSVALTMTNLRNADLPDLSVPMADLRGVQAAGAWFSHGCFDGVWWGGADLNGAKLDRTRNVGADFERADLRGASFHGADLSGARLANVRAQGADFRFAVMPGADFSDADCDSVAFAHNHLDDASMRRSRLRHASFFECRADAMRLTGAKAANSHWERVTMKAVCVAGADMRRVVMQHCELTRMNAREAKFDGATFVACDLREAHFGGASLKRLRLGAACQLGGTQWQGARIRLDAAWLRSLPSDALADVVQSWMTLPIEQPAVRADVFGQVLRALAVRSGSMPLRRDATSAQVPSLSNLRIDVQQSEWLGRLLAAEPGVGGVGMLDGFSALREQWLSRAIDDLTGVPLTRVQAAWIVPSLVQTLEARCLAHSPEAVWPLAGAVCQTLYWAGSGLGGVTDAQVQALRKAWHDTLPAHLHSALSDDGTDAFGPKHFVLVSADGCVAARLPRHLLKICLDDATHEIDDARHIADFTGAGWQWMGVRVVVNDGDIDNQYRAGEMSQLHALIRDFGCLREVWPTERRLDEFVRLLSRWLGDAGGDAVNAMLHSDIPSCERQHSHTDGVPTRDRVDALVALAAHSDSERLRRLAHQDIDEVFRETAAATLSADRMDPESRRAMQARQRQRLLAIAAGLTWLAVQPEAQVAQAVPGPLADLLKHYALAAFNDALSGEPVWRALPQSRILRSCLADPACDAATLAGGLAGWMASPTVHDDSALVALFAETLPWFWAANLPLTSADTAALMPAANMGDATEMTPSSPDNGP